MVPFKAGKKRSPSKPQRGIVQVLHNRSQPTALTRSFGLGAIRSEVIRFIYSQAVGKSAMRYAGFFREVAAALSSNKEVALHTHSKSGPIIHP